MKAILITALLFMACVCHADVTPSCFPGEATADNPDGHIQRNAIGCAFVWFCDEGHKWVGYGFYGSTNECQAFVTANKFADFAGLSHDQKLALWNALPQDNPADAATKPLLTNAPKPASAPPSGLVTQTNIAYARVEAIGTYTLKPVGLIKPGTQCDANVKLSDSGGDYYGIPTAIARTPGVVSMQKKGNYTPPYPSTVYGKCT